MAEGLELNPQLDADKLRLQFAQHGRIHIPDILTPPSAQRLLRCLNSETPWNLVLNEGEKHHDISPGQWQALSDEQRAGIRNGALARARYQFQYMYNDYPIADAYQRKINPGHFLNRVFEFVNSGAFLDFVKEVSGIDSITYADSQATAFGPGHFLTEHNDAVTGKNRRLAYVINMTPVWQADWGGILNFFDEHNNVETGFVPAFNALNMFAIPAPHAVSYVIPSADGVRYSITGWLREGEPQWG